MKKFFLLTAMLCALTSPAAAQNKLTSVSYNPSGVTTTAQMERGFSEAQIRADLSRVAAYAMRVRTYTVEFGLDKVPAIARALGLKVSLGIWLDYDRAKNAATIVRAVKVIAANADVIDVVFVGNEAVYRGDLPAADVVSYINQVKNALSKVPVKITTAEPWHVWLKHPELARAVETLGVHMFPNWDGVPIGDAMPYFDRRVSELKAAFPGKAVMIAETGWPWKGATTQAAVASSENQMAFTRAFLKSMRDANYNFVEAFDQPWKAGAEQGALWGMFDDNGKPKFDFFKP
jgi:exo-beta-1,3-glucanase (GH17 family)